MDRERIRLLSLIILVVQQMIRFVTIIPAPPNECLVLRQVYMHLIGVCFQFLGQIVAFITSLAPPTYTQLNLRDRLLPNFHGHRFEGRDVFRMICQQRYLLWLNTGETP